MRAGGVGGAGIRVGGAGIRVGGAGGAGMRGLVPCRWAIGLALTCSMGHRPSQASTRWTPGIAGHDPGDPA
jgi:hypothetical protein